MLGTGQLGILQLGESSEEEDFTIGFGQAQAKILAFNYPRHAQAQALIIRFTDELGTQYSFGGNIIPGLDSEPSSKSYAQAQAQIKQIYFGFGQARAFIPGI